MSRSITHPPSKPAQNLLVLDADSPFSIAPDPFNLFVTPSLQAILNKVKYVVQYRQGLTVILGDVGLGKSSVLKLMHGQLSAYDNVKTAFIQTPSGKSDFSLLKSVCFEFELPPRRSITAQENELKEFLYTLYQEEKTAVIFIDEAQKLLGSQMELIRSLTNIETAKHKLIQIVLAAQREFENKLRDESKKAIKSRIIFPSFLSPLSPAEAQDMMNFRCERGGIKNPFDNDGFRIIYEISNGNPRDILKIANAAYMLLQQAGISQFPAEELSDLAREALIQ